MGYILQLCRWSSWVDPAKIVTPGKAVAADTLPPAGLCADGWLAEEALFGPTCAAICALESLRAFLESCKSFSESSEIVAVASSNPRRPFCA